jgi:ribosome recycling factor
MTDHTELRKRMDGALNTLKHEFTGLRTGRASPNLLDSVTVEAYGSPMPLNQVANVNVPEPRLITVSVWDKSMVKAVEKAIQTAGLGLNPAADGQMIRVPLPELSQERRQELVKFAGKTAENTRIAIRNVRRDGMDFAKKQEKDGKISKDEHEKQSAAIQKLTDEFIKKVDEMPTAKEKDIMQV